MPSRIVREGIISSDRVALLSLGAEVLYRRLMSVADDYGRYHGSVVTLRGACWPINPERIREKEVGKWLNELLRGEEPLVKTYAIRGSVYLEIQNFGQQVRGKSKFPNPPWVKDQQLNEESAKQMISDDKQGADGPIQESVNECEADAQPSRIRIRSRIAESYSDASPLAPQGGQVDYETPIDSQGLVRSDVPAVNGNGKVSGRQRRGRRTTEEIKRALGPERLRWWEGFWGAFPCHEGMNPAMDAYERKIHTRELAVEVYNGAKRYASQMAARWQVEPDAHAKYGQGWINAERWTDESRPVFGPRLTSAEAKRIETEVGLGVMAEIRRMS